jgi:soluble P-type ATPase
MAVGSGIIDIMMMREANISIAVSSKFVASDLQAVSDIKVADLSSLIYLLLRHGISISKKMQMTL